MLPSVRMTPDVASATASSSYGPVKALANLVGEHIAPYKLCTPTPPGRLAVSESVGDLINSAEYVAARKGLDAQLGVTTTVEDDVPMA